ncbi:hexitol phosphatase HxpB [Pedobacter miscanthi]|uniref:Hexitol phosphatase HxpB n=1 Tax=Pedobacter miscanthi TaxID=2259170 RepID=A0A366LC66_9SPHI|nr:hexitol phosphatase HxpB [Pedobacter miscanthi]RBQ11478.1 hexitol phosphatase HxpB [Pedobacter miscanthi]
MFQAAIFDMDGLLIDSEPFWRTAEKEVFGSLGIEVTEELSIKTSRMTTREVTAHWFSHKPWAQKSLEDVEQTVIQKVGELIGNNGVMMPGSIALLHYFKQSGYKIGLATNSPQCLIPIVLRKLQIEHCFDITVSSDFVDKGKPSPDIYIKAASELSTPPSRCIVFEDSARGIQAALAAGMSVVAVPEKGNFHDSRFNIADIKIRQLSDFCDQHIALLIKKQNNLVKL